MFIRKDRLAFNFMHLVKMFSEALKHVLDVYHVPIFIITVLINFLILYLQWYEKIFNN